MSMSNYVIEVQETADFKSGWQSAERGEPRPNWKPLPGEHSEKLERQKLGWDFYHEQGRAL